MDCAFCPSTEAVHFLEQTEYGSRDVCDGCYEELTFTLISSSTGDFANG